MSLRAALLAAAMLASAAAATAQPMELLYVAEGNRLRRYDIDTIHRGELLSEIVFQNAETDPDNGRDINGMVCAVPGEMGLFIAGEDTGQPNPPAGWGILTAYGTQLGKLTPTYIHDKPEPYGCAFDAEGRLFTTAVGRPFFGAPSGQLVVWFPPFREFPGPPGAYPQTDAVSGNACKLATDLGTALGIAIDPEGRIYVATASGREVVRFSPPYPTSADAAGGCGATDPTGAPMADRVQRERFLGARWGDGLITYSGLAFARSGNLYVSSVATGRIGEVDPDGNLVRMVLDPDDTLPPYETGYPQGLAVDSRGTLYYADLDLKLRGVKVGTGSDGKLWRIRFDAAGEPLPPEMVARGLAFPDAVSVLPGDLEGAAAAGILTPAPPTLPSDETQPSGSGGVALMALIGVVTAGAMLLARRRRKRPHEL